MSFRGRAKHLFATDYTAFESHFEPRVMEALELPLYDYMLQNYPEACRVIHRTLSGKNSIRTNIGLSLDVQGKRMSGDMCTSLGNGWSNFCLASFLSTLKGDKDFDGLFEGDDGLISTDADLTAKDFEELGFTIKIDEPTDPLKASFCGVILSATGQAVRDPVAFFSKFGWTQSCLDAGMPVMMQLQKAKALSALWEMPACPLVTAAAWYSLNQAGSCEPRWEENVYKHVPTDFTPTSESIDHATRLLFSELYGISPDTQIMLEGHLKSGNFAILADYLIPASDPEQGVPMYDYLAKFVG